MRIAYKGVSVLSVGQNERYCIGRTMYFRDSVFAFIGGIMLNSTTITMGTVPMNAVNLVAMGR